MGRKENKVETYLHEQLVEIGGTTIKMIRVSVDGFPDRFAIVPSRHPKVGTKLELIETKAQGGELSPQQINCHRILETYGIRVVSVYSKDDVDTYTKWLLGDTPWGFPPDEDRKPRDDGGPGIWMPPR